MASQDIIFFGSLVTVILVLLFILIKIWTTVRKLSASFAKLGYIVREDAKRYFDDASDKVVDTNKQFQDIYQKIVEDATRKVVSESGVITEKIVADAHTKANDIILSARKDAQQILQDAQNEADGRAEKTLQQTGDAIEWVVSKYLDEIYTVEEHKALIEKQIKAYADEHRK